MWDCSTLKIPQRLHWHHSGAFFVNLEHISHLVLVFVLLTLNKQMMLVKSRNGYYRKSHQRCTVKTVLLEISRNSQENICTRVSNFVKKEKLVHRYFPVNFAKFLMTAFLQNTPVRLILLIDNVTVLFTENKDRLKFGKLHIIKKVWNTVKIKNKDTRKMSGFFC